MQYSIRRTRSDSWAEPRQSLDPCSRLHKYGRVRPMDQDRSFLERLFAR